MSKEKIGIILFSGLLLYETFSGIVCFFSTAESVFVQYNVLFHILFGVLFGSILGVYYYMHWKKYQSKEVDEKQKARTMGHIIAYLFLLSFFTGVAMIFTGISGSWSILLWAHIVVSFVAIFLLLKHAATLQIVSDGMSKLKTVKVEERFKELRSSNSIRSVFIFTLLVLFITLVSSSYRQITPEVVERPNYTMPFDSLNPFSPNLATTHDMKFIPEEAMVNSASCGQSNCHVDIYEQWSESAHRFSIDNPWVQKTIGYLSESAGKNYTRYCGGCHDPIALLSGQLDENGPGKNNFHGEGISCISCHSINKITTLEGTGSYEFILPKRYLYWDRTGTVPEYLNYLLIKLKPESHAETFSKPFYSEASYCSPCHKQHIDKNMNNYCWLRLQNQYDNWQKSGHSQESVFAKELTEKKTCNNCHMPLVPAKDPSAKNKKVHSHRFLAANTAIPHYYNFPNQLQKTKEWLEEGYIQIDIFGLIDNPFSPNPKLYAPLEENQVKTPDDSTKYVFEVVVTNKMPITFPTGPLDIYQPWVEFEVVDANGAVIYSNGRIEGKQDAPYDAHQFIAPLVTKNGEWWVRRHDLWNVHGKPFNNTIPPQKSVLIHYLVNINSNASFPLKATTRVRYRRFNRWYTEWALGKNAPTFPVIDVCTDTVIIGNKSINSIKERNNIRYLNYAEGLFSQKKYNQAIKAYSAAIALAPDYVDAYIGIGESYMSMKERKVDAAIEQFSKALKQKPNSLKVKAWLGVTYLQQGWTAKAKLLLEEVYNTYPKDRRILLELARCFVSLSEPQKSIELLLASLEIDPEQEEVYFLLKECYYATGDKESGDKALHKYERLSEKFRENLKLTERFRRTELYPKMYEKFFEDNQWALNELKLYHYHE